MNNIDTIKCPYCNYNKPMTQETIDEIQESLTSDGDSTETFCENCHLNFFVNLQVEYEYFFYVTDAKDPHPKEEKLIDCPGQTFFNFYKK